jgi:hypothetical protein
MAKSQISSDFCINAEISCLGQLDDFLEIIQRTGDTCGIARLWHGIARLYALRANVLHIAVARGPQLLTQPRHPSQWN